VCGAYIPSVLVLRADVLNEDITHSSRVFNYQLIDDQLVNNYAASVES
jgi:hypothetical protein